MCTLKLMLTVTPLIHSTNGSRPNREELWVTQSNGISRKYPLAPIDRSCWFLSLHFSVNSSSIKKEYPSTVTLQLLSPLLWRKTSRNCSNGKWSHSQRFTTPLSFDTLIFDVYFSHINIIETLRMKWRMYFQINEWQCNSVNGWE